MLRKVGDELGEREDQASGGVVLRERAVHPGAHAQRGRVQLACIQQCRAEGSEPVAALRPHIRAFVVRAQVVEAEVIRGGDEGHVGPGILNRHPPSGLADHQGDLTLEGEQFGAGGPLDRASGCCDRARRLQEVRRRGRPAAALVGARGIAQVDRNDLAGAHRECPETAGRGIRRKCHELPRSCVIFEIVYDRSTSGK